MLRCSNIMDKYTVDLDQVLNEFEYNEMKSDPPPITTSSTPEMTPNCGGKEGGSPHAKADHGPKKHSINAVFNCLNEYVNNNHTSSSSNSSSSSSSSSSTEIDVERASPPPVNGAVIGFDEQLPDVDDEEFVQTIDQIEEEFKTVERPNQLALAEVAPPSSQSIDLIGAPGSTPFNNSYDIEAELDEGYPVSVSPTFSEMSTETTSSLTPSVGGGDGPAVVPVPPPPPAPSATGTTAPPIGSTAPHWVPDTEAGNCLHCNIRFTVLKRRHHCRACGLVLCSKCCHHKCHLTYMDAMARVCTKCFEALNLLTPQEGATNQTVPPLQQQQQMAVVPSPPPPVVMVPVVGVLKRSSTQRVKSTKSVMFCDGIRPGSDLTHLDQDFNYTNHNHNNSNNSLVVRQNTSSQRKCNNTPFFDVNCEEEQSTALPPIVTCTKTDCLYTECENGPDLVLQLRDNQMTFALHTNYFVHVKIVNLDCCVKKTVWSFCTEGLITIGQDEIVILLEIPQDSDESRLPRDLFVFFWQIYTEAERGNIIRDLGVVLYQPNTTTNTTSSIMSNASGAIQRQFLQSKNHAGFIFVRATRQCLKNVIRPHDEPFLIGLLIHRWETPWAKLFPLRLVLRLGAEYRYYPVPIVSTRHRDSLYVEVGHTIINILADFRNFSYTLPDIKGLHIHMEGRNTRITIPTNRYKQVMKTIQNSSDHILAFAGNFSAHADAHLVCIQDTHSAENAYSTHTIDIHNKPRKVIGASFIVFNGALKVSSGLTAKSNVVEDGLMVQVVGDQLSAIRDSLKAMRTHTIQCGVQNNEPDECVTIEWVGADTGFNVGVTSAIDGRSLGGVPSIRTPSFQDFLRQHSGRHLIRCTEVFIVQNDGGESMDVARISESVANATCTALVKYIDLLATNDIRKVGMRTTLSVEQVSYVAGSGHNKLPPIYMRHLDNELVPVLHRIISHSFGDNDCLILEFVFRILYNAQR